MASEIVHPHHPSNSRDKLYRDFTLTKDNCSSEPIHRPTAIQGQGHLAAFDTTGQPTLVAISHHLASQLGHETSSLWTQHAKDYLPDPITALLNKANSVDYSPQCLPQTIRVSDKAFQLSHHQHAGKLILEFEPEADTEVDDQIIRAVAQDFRESTNSDSLYRAATQKVKNAFGYDRVMIYKFDHDQHGMVVGEDKADDQEPFLGLHYPETDIPKIARDLFLLVKSRGISDVNMHTVPLHFNPQLAHPPPYLDLSYSQLRAISPIHTQYLQNMDVAASLTFSIIVQGKLWGLIACHHRTPRQVQFSHKLVGEVIAELFAKRIFELEIEERTKLEARAREVESFFLKQVTMSDNYRVQIIEHAACINQLCEADGAALVTLDQCIYSNGIAPSDITLLAIREWLVNEGHEEVYCTDYFSNDVAVNADFEHPIGGMLSTSISALSRSYMLWFRMPKTQTINWAGDPDNSFSVTTGKAGEDIQLNPRQSFAKWQVQLEGRSQRWEDSAQEMADRIRQGIYKIELRHTAQIIDRSNAEFMQLTYAAAHDLQEPIRTQTNYLELLKDSLGNTTDDSTIHYLSRTENASNRMNFLVNDLLSYSQLGASNRREKVDLTEIVSTILDELEFNLTETHTQVTVEPLPIIIGDSSKLKQLVRNLLTNAIKYVSPGKKPKVSIYMIQDGSFWTLNVKDNGIGIDPEFHSDIFVMFKRLHGKTEFEGSGIGLAICAKVVESMDGEIGVKSTIGEGSTFWVRFHNSVMVKD